MIVVLTGDVGSGKTTLLAGLLDILKSLSMSADGFLGVRVFEKDRFSGYDLVDVRDGRRLPFLRRAEGAGTAAVSCRHCHDRRCLVAVALGQAGLCAGRKEFHAVPCVQMGKRPAD